MPTAAKAVIPAIDRHVNPHLGFGTMELLTPADYKPHYSSFFHETDIGAAGFDWTKFPGTTDVFLPLEKIAWRGDWQHRSDQSFVGGVDAPNGAGVFVLSLHGPKKIGLDSFYARKTWFFFGDTILCLGSGIRNTVFRPRNRHDALSGFLASARRQGKNHHAVFLERRREPQPVSARKAGTARLAALADQPPRQSGSTSIRGSNSTSAAARQRCPSSDGKKETAGKFTTAWLSHGNAPQNASYRYLMRVGATPGSHGRPLGIHEPERPL